MNWLRLGSTLANIVLQYPLENHIKPDHTKSEKMLEEMRSSVSAQAVAEQVEAEEELAPAGEELELPEVVKREREGDYCLSCIPSKHLMKAKDGLTDALNIVKAEGKFTEVAEGKVQRAVYNLNGAEDDLELARVSPSIKPAVEEMHAQVRRVRNYLRSDQSGLETGTLMEDAAEAKESLEVAIEVVDSLISAGYDLTKLQIRERANTIRGDE